MAPQRCGRDVTAVHGILAAGSLPRCLCWCGRHGLNAAWGLAPEAEGAPPFWPWRQAVGIDAETFASW